jgi:hypothetical protein
MLSAEPSADDLSPINVTAPYMVDPQDATSALSPYNAANLFYYGTLGGIGVGTASGLTIGYFVGGAEVAEGAGPLAALDAMGNLAFLGMAEGAALGGVGGFGAFALYEMSQLPPPPSGQGYGYPTGNFLSY